MRNMQSTFDLTSFKKMNAPRSVSYTHLRAHET